MGQGNDGFVFGLGLTGIGATTSTIRGNDGNDTISLNGAINASLINGNAGQDSITISGALSNGSKILGGDNNDTIELLAASFASGTTANGNVGDDTLRASAALGANMSGATIFGGQGNDTFTFTASGFNVILSGDDGNDTINSGIGADTLWGGAGNDTISAGAGNDSLLGGSGNDVLIGGAGADTMFGGDGADTFVSEAAATSAVVAGSFISAGSQVSGILDVITNFASGIGGDFIDITGGLTYVTPVVIGTAETVPVGTVATAETTYAISGTFSNGTFTIGANNAAGPDTLIIKAGATGFNAATQAVVLTGDNS